jgi:hypothetical protein
MVVTIHLAPETEEKLRQRAAASGQSLDRYVEQLIEGALAGANGDQPGRMLPSDKALAPFRQEVAASGMSDEELRTFFEEVREEVYREEHGGPGKAP